MYSHDDGSKSWWGWRIHFCWYEDCIKNCFPDVVYLRVINSGARNSTTCPCIKSQDGCWWGQEDVLALFRENPHTSRQVAVELGLGITSIHRILRGERWHPYKLQLVKDLTENDFQTRTTYCYTKIRCQRSTSVRWNQQNWQCKSAQHGVGLLGISQASMVPWGWYPVSLEAERMVWYLMGSAFWIRFPGRRSRWSTFVEPPADSTNVQWAFRSCPTGAGNTSLATARALWCTGT